MISTVEKEFMIAGLRRQRDLLNDLILRLRGREKLDDEARLLYDSITKEVEENLRRLKKYQQH
jgi:hypothetical protein